MSNMKSFLIVYHSRTQGAMQMAQAAANAASKEAGLTVQLLQADQVTAEKMLEAHGYLFVAPENLGSMSGLMKEFFDRTYYDLLDHLNGRPYATMICAGSDGQGAALQIKRIATGWRLNEVCPPLIVKVAAQTRTEIVRKKTIDPKQLELCAEVGVTVAVGLSCGVF